MPYITMHGPAFDESGQIVETQVHFDNIAAFKRAGWKEGGLPSAEVQTRSESRVVVTEATSTTPVRCKARKSNGERCANDAVKNSDYCHIKSHQPK